MLRTLFSSFSSSSSSAATLFFAPSSSSPSSAATLFFAPSSSSRPFHPLRAARAAPLPCLDCPPCSQVDKHSTMEALKPSLRPETSQPCQQQSQGALSEEVCWVVERGNFLSEGFSVDDLLDLGEFADNEVEAEEDVNEAEQSASSSSPSSSSSALSFEIPAPAPAPAPAPSPAPLSDICLPAHDAEELEWVSYIIDDSISEFPPPPPPPPCSGVASLSPPPCDAQHEDRQGRAAPPQRQGSSGPTVCALSTEAMVPVKAKRSKRSRGATAAWSMSGSLPFADSSSSSTTTSSTSSCSSTSSSSPLLIYDPSAGSVEQTFLLSDHLPPSKKQKPKKRGRKPKSLPSTTPAFSGERRCSHCGVQKTPQWRAGPLGAKTLCNACGVRFKSGRLLPEYRPACSPTFVSHMHSNSHRKVLEMRRQKETVLLPTAAALPVASF